MWCVTRNCARPGNLYAVKPPRLVLLSAHPECVDGTRALVEQYIRLPDAWVRYGGVPERLPRAFELEIAEFPGSAAPPFGDVVVAVAEDGVVATGEVVPFDGSRCEFKRVFVRPEHSGAGVGRKLVAAMIDRAGALGYMAAVLDVMPERTRAVHVWKAAGFHACEAHRDYGVPMVFMSRTLSPSNEPRT